MRRRLLVGVLIAISLLGLLALVWHLFWSVYGDPMIEGSDDE